jgi:hypothetical protein
LAFGMYTRRTGTGSHDERERCTRTAISALASGDKATSPSIPAVRRPALRWVTCRTLTSVFDQEPSINFCSDRTAAQSCSRVAVNILRRNLITFCSWARQSLASQFGVTSSGPFTTTVSNLPLRFIRSSVSVFTGSPAHVSSVSSPAPRLVSDRFPGPPPWRRCYRSHESRCLSAVGIGFLDILSRRGVPPLLRSAYQNLEKSWTRRGFHVPRT